MPNEIHYQETQGFFDVSWAMPAGLILIAMTLGFLALLPSWGAIVGLGIVAAGVAWLARLRISYKISAGSLEVRSGAAALQIQAAEITDVQEAGPGITLPFRLQGKPGIYAWSSGLGGQIVGMKGKTVRIQVSGRHLFVRTASPTEFMRALDAARAATR